MPHLVSQCKFDFSKLLKGDAFVIIEFIYKLFVWSKMLVVLKQSLQSCCFLTSPGIVSEKGIREEVAPVLQYQILQLALELPASKFSWFRIQVKKLHCFISLFILALFSVFCLDGLDLC